MLQPSIDQGLPSPCALTMWSAVVSINTAAVADGL
jgi:hypothetical protein